MTQTWQLALLKDSVHVAHLKPFGAHTPPDPVDEYRAGELPSPQTFWTKYVQTRRPVVFRGAGRNSPAFEKWTDEFLATRYGDLEVRLEARKEKQGYIPIGDKGVGRDTIRNFINTYHKANKYIVSELPRPMYDDIMVISPMTCGEFSRRLVEIDWWMNGGNASSIIHKDAFNQINCLLNGTKEWKLIEYKHEKSIYKAWEPDREIGGYSRVNPERVDLIKYPKVATVPWMFTTLKGGDCLYLPGSMYHQVKSYGTNNFAVSLLFSRFDDRKSLNFSDCANESLPEQQHKSLGSFDVDWQYPGTGVMTMGEPDLEHVKFQLYSLIKQKGMFAKNLAQKILKEIYDGKDDVWLLEKAEQVYSKMKNLLGHDLNKDNVKSMTKEALRIFALVLQPIDASNTYDHEYLYVSPHDIKYLVEGMLKKDGKLSRVVFVQMYQQKLYGTAKFAEEFFNKIAGESENEASKEQVERNMHEALEKYLLYQRNEPETPTGETTVGDAYDGNKEDTEMFETGMPDMSEEDDSEEDDSEENDNEEDENAPAETILESSFIKNGKDEL